MMVYAGAVKWKGSEISYLTTWVLFQTLNTQPWMGT